MKIEIGVCLREKERKRMRGGGREGKRKERGREKRTRQKGRLKVSGGKKERERKGKRRIFADANIRTRARVAMRFTLCTCQSTSAVRMLMTPK